MKKLEISQRCDDSAHYQPKDLNLKFYFTPTKSAYGEWRKAEIKNYNLPILQYWFNGDPYEPIKCLISKQIGFTHFSDIVSRQPKQRFACDFNHIRQHQDGTRHSGTSIDKGKYVPSDIFRRFRLDKPQHQIHLIEMMATITVHTQYHSYISQDSANDHITLLNFKREWWPWGLQNKSNFYEFCNTYYLNLNYSKFKKVLTNINQPSIINCFYQGLLQ